MTTPMFIEHAHYQQMLQHVSAQLPEEACGLVAGKQSKSVRVYPIENQLHSATKFRMEPHAQVQALLELEQQGWELLAIYHSHPDGPVEPSPTDLAEASYPEAVALIWSRNAGGWKCRGFTIQEGEFRAFDVQILP